MQETSDFARQQLFLDGVDQLIAIKSGGVPAFRDASPHYEINLTFRFQFRIKQGRLREVWQREFLATQLLPREKRLKGLDCCLSRELASVCKERTRSISL